MWSNQYIQQGGQAVARVFEFRLVDILRIPCNIRNDQEALLCHVTVYITGYEKRSRVECQRDRFCWNLNCKAMPHRVCQ